MKLIKAFDPKNNSIGSIRLACALAVIMGHASPYGGYGDTFLMRLTDQQVSGARVAVDLFFVISGFLLTASWERSSPLVYARNRFLRIFPGLWACLIVTGILTPLAFGVAPGIKYVATNMFLVFGLERTIPGLFADHLFTTVNGALWTLPWEVYCYISLPVLAACGLLRPRLAVPIFIGLWAAFIFKIISAESMKSTSAITSPLRLFAFFYAGVVLHMYRDKIEMSAKFAAIAAAILVFATALGTVTFRHPGGLFYVFAPFTVSYLVLYASVKLPFTKINSKTDISYGLYIYGTFIIQVMVAIGLNSTTVSYWLLATISVAVAIPVALLSWFLIEQPAMRLKGRAISPTTLVRSPAV